MLKKIWQLEDDKIYKLNWENKLEGTLYKVWQDKMFYFNNCINDWVELNDGFGLYEEVTNNNC